MKKAKNNQNNILYGISIGLCLGVGLSFSLNNLVLGITIGLTLGAAIAASLDSKKKK